MTAPDEWYESLDRTHNIGLLHEYLNMWVTLPYVFVAVGVSNVLIYDLLMRESSALSIPLNSTCDVQEMGSDKDSTTFYYESRSRVTLFHCNPYTHDHMLEELLKGNQNDYLQYQAVAYIGYQRMTTNKKFLSERLEHTEKALDYPIHQFVVR